GPTNRGLAVGVDESAGYIGVGLGGFAAGLLVSSYGLRPTPYLLALGVVVLGVLVTLGPAKETIHFARTESAGMRSAGPSPAESPATPGPQAQAQAPQLRRLAAYMSWHDRSMLAVCQAGFFNKFADSLVAAFFPLYLLRRGVSLAEVGLLVGVYAWVWGLGQVAAGALADRVGRKLPITAGTFLIAGGLGLFVATSAHGAWFAGAALMGVGMALAYPNLITAVGDVANPVWRGGALGVYRLWRDGGYAIGPLVLGGIAATAGITAAIWAGAALLGASGLTLLVLLRETDPHRRRSNPAWQSHPEWVAP
ncbi:MAG: MFS transporter, partial [Acidimicrobiales bacterium]